MLVSFALGDANFLCRPCTFLSFFVDFTPFPVEYKLRWVPGVGSLRWACTFNIFCLGFICVGLPTQTQFSVEYGL